MENRAVKILAIDDNKDNLTILKALIMESFPKAIVLTAFTGQKGLETAEKEEPDVILLDIIMPGMDGNETCRKLKADKKLCDIPVVFVTAIKNDKASRIKALECGAEAFLAKPIDESELTAQIRAMLKIRAANIQKRDENELLVELVEEKTKELKDANAKTLKLLEDVKREQALIEAIFDSIPGFMYVYEENGKLIKWNKKQETMTGYTTEELSHMTLEKWFDQEDIVKVNAAVRDVFEKGYGEVEAQLILKSGDKLMTRSSGAPLVLDGNKYFTGIGVDITERKKLEMQLQQNMDDLLASQRIAHLGTWRINFTTNQVVWSEELYKMYGFDPTIPPPPYTEHMKLFTTESWNKLSKALEQTRTSGIPYELELETITKDGANGWMWLRGEAVRDSSGIITGLWGAAQNITEHKKIQFEIKQSEEKFQLLFNKAPLGYQSLDFDGRFIDVNHKWLETLGYSREEVIGKWFGDFLCPEYVDGFRQRFPLFKAQGYIHSEFEMLSKNGQRLFIAFDGKIGYDTDGEFKQTHCILQDITSQRKAEKALEESEEKYRHLFEYSGVGIGYFTTDGIVISYNKKALENLGGSLEDYTGKSISDVFPKEMAETLFERIGKAMQENQPQEYEDYAILNTGPKWFSSIITKILDTSGEVVGVQITSLDITERKKAESELIYLAYHDQLTGLYNRRYFDESLGEIDNKQNLPLSVVIADINGLKLINDSFGNEAGDRIIVETAKLICSCCREDDILARLGGDEFIVLLPKTDLSSALMLIKTIKNAFEQYNLNIFNKSLHINISFGADIKETIDDDITKVFKRAEEYLSQHKLLDKNSSYSSIISSIKATMLEKSQETEAHAERIAKLSKEVGLILNLSQNELDHLELLATLHDIGKVGIDERILRKPGKLDTDEWTKMKKHPEIGFRIAMSSPNLAPIASYILYHHERWDGYGYPQNLKGTDIPLISRIISVVDAYDAMTEDRVYQKAKTHEEAIEEIRKCAGSQFDPHIAKIFIETMCTRDVYKEITT